MSEDDQTTAIGLARYANEYYRAGLAADQAIGFDKGYEIHAPPPVLFLVSHALELILKSYLRHAGATASDIRKFRHDIWRCYEAAINYGLDAHVALSERDEALLKLISEVHASTEMRYIKTGPKELPIFGPMSELARSLLKPISAAVGWRFVT